MHISPTDSALQRLIARAGAAERADDPALARRLWLHAVQLDPTLLPAWEALARLLGGAQQAMCFRWIAHLQAPQAVPPPQRWRLVPRPWLIPTTAGLLAAVWAGGMLPYYDRVVPGVTISDVAVGGLNTFEAQTRVAQALVTRGAQVVTLNADGRAWTVPLHQLTTTDLAAVSAAYAIGHQGAWWTQAVARWTHIGGARQDVVGMVINDGAVDQVVTQLARALDRPALDAQLVRTPWGWASSPTRIGKLVDRAALRVQLVQLATTNADAALAIDVPFVPVPPQRTADALQPVLAQLNALHRQPLWIAVGDARWSVERTALVTGGLDGAPLTVNEGAVAQLIARFAQATDRAAQPARLEHDGDRVRAFALGVPGVVLDQTAATEALRTAIFASATERQLPTVATQPAPGEAEQLGLLAELGRGESQFVTYSSLERDANVVAGGHDVDGVLLPPGGEFSFGDTVGEITWEKGYRWGEMIEQGQVKPALGGGICQVSTTVFRAALSSGLPITERHAHSWRLPWYEVDAPPGLDATISLGGPDLRFRNDTPGYILITVQTDVVHKRQTVVIYGTPMGRTVHVLPDPGNGIAVVRHIQQNGVEVRNETFRSVYVQ